MATVNPITELRKYIKMHGTQHAAAQALGVSDTFVGYLLRGRRTFSDRVLAELGLTRRISYQRLYTWRYSR